MSEFKNTLFINFGGIGDEILFLPTLAAFKQQYSFSKITLALEARSKAIKNLTDILDDVITVNIKEKGLKKYFNILKFIFEIRSRNFNCVISSGKSPFIALILFLSGIKERVGYRSKTDFLLTKKVSLNENQYAGKMYYDLVKPLVSVEYQNPKINVSNDFELDNSLSGEFIVIHPGVSKMSIQKNILKCPDSSFWVNLICELLNKNKKIVLMGTEDDSDLVEKILENKYVCNNQNFINYYKKTKNIMEMAFIMKKAKYVICADSAPMHVAISVDTRTFAIFGPTNELKLVPDDKNVTIVKNNNIQCRPCLWHKRTQNCNKSDCLKIDYKIITDKIN